MLYARCYNGVLREIFAASRGRKVGSSPEKVGATQPCTQGPTVMFCRFICFQAIENQNWKGEKLSLWDI